MSYHTYEAAPGDLESHPSCLLDATQVRGTHLPVSTHGALQVRNPHIHLRAHTLREIRTISPISPWPQVLFHLLPKSKESSHTFLVIFGFPLIMFHQGKRAFPDTYAERIFLRSHVFSLSLPPLRKSHVSL